MNRGDYVNGLKAERAFVEGNYPDDDARAKRLADIDAELSNFEDAPAPTGRRSGRAPETA